MSQRAESSDAVATATTAQAVLQGAEPVAFEHAHQPRTSAQLAVGIAVLVVAGLLWLRRRFRALRAERKAAAQAADEQRDQQ